MVGDSYDGKQHEMNKLLPEFSGIVQDIFDCTAPLMAIPPTFAQKYKLKIWSKFEKSVTRTLEIADEIVNVGLKMNGNGLLKEMRDNQMSTEMIKRIFIDLIIAAGDTVTNPIIYGRVAKTLMKLFFFLDCILNTMGSIHSKH